MSGPDASLVMRCDCSDLGHMIVFDALHWDTDKPAHSELYAHMELEAGLPWWRRLLAGARYVATGRTTKWWWVDNVIPDDGAGHLRDFLTDYLARSLNASVDRSPEGEKPQALNAKHESAGPKDDAQTVSAYNPDNRLSTEVEEIITAWAYAHDINGAARNDLFARLRESRATLSDSSVIVK